MNEKLIERKLCNYVRKLGGIAIKIYSPSFTGLPDRLILLPGGRVWFVELKSTGKIPGARQRAVMQMLMKLGFGVWVIDDEIKLRNFQKEMAA